MSNVTATATNSSTPYPGSKAATFYMDPPSSPDEARLPDALPAGATSFVEKKTRVTQSTQPINYGTTTTHGGAAVGPSGALAYPQTKSTGVTGAIKAAYSDSAEALQQTGGNVTNVARDSGKFLMETGQTVREAAAVTANTVATSMQRAHEADPGYRPVTMAGYYSYAATKVGAMVCLAAGIISLFFTTTTLVPISGILLIVSAICAIDFIGSSIYRGYAIQNNTQAQPLTAVDEGTDTKTNTNVALKPRGSQQLSDLAADLADISHQIEATLATEKKNYLTARHEHSKVLNRKETELKRMTHEYNTIAAQGVTNVEEHNKNVLALQTTLSDAQSLLNKTRNDLSRFEQMEQEELARFGDLQKQIQALASPPNLPAQSKDMLIEIRKTAASIEDAINKIKTLNNRTAIVETPASVKQVEIITKTTTVREKGRVIATGFVEETPPQPIGTSSTTFLSNAPA